MESNDLFGTLKQFNQNRILTALNTLNEEERENLIKTLNNVDFWLMKELYGFYLDHVESFDKPKEDRFITPIESLYSRNDFGEEQIKEITELGYDSVFNGRVALLILAGGQGSRLGFDKAKGMFPVDLLSNKTIFEYLLSRLIRIHELSAEKLNKDKDLSKVTVLMLTSPENNDEIADFLKENNYFGLNKENFNLFAQDTLPAIDSKGELVLKSPSELYLNPNGNGGLLLALRKYKILEDCLQKGIDYIHIITQDNPLAKPLDPFFIGLTIYYNHSMAAKSVPKKSPTDKVGVFLNLNGKPEMMDYADMPSYLNEQLDSNGKLLYRAGNMLNYLLSVKKLSEVLLNEETLKEIAKEFHIAVKNNKTFEPESNSYQNNKIIKFELFLNSIFHYVDERGLLLLEVDPNEEFAPIKNSNENPTDTPNTSRQLIYNLFKKWFKNAGGQLSNEDINIEIDFRLSYDGENLTNIPKYLDNDILIK